MEANKRSIRPDHIACRNDWTNDELAALVRIEAHLQTHGEVISPSLLMWIMGKRRSDTASKAAGDLLRSADRAGFRSHELIWLDECGVALEPDA